MNTSDYEQAEAYTERWRKARKTHRCGECCSDIRPGERYEYASGIWDGEPDSHKTCVLCVALRDAARDADKVIDEELGFLFGQVYEGAFEAFSELRHYDAPAVLGTLAGALWLYAERVNNGRGFYNGRGFLRPVVRETQTVSVKSGSIVV